MAESKPLNRCKISKWRCSIRLTKNMRPLGSAVEHSLHTRGVSSSNLLAGTNFLRSKTPEGDAKSPFWFSQTA